MILKTVNKIPDAPTPTIVPLIYRPGSIPARPNIPFCINDNNTPIIIIVALQIYQEAFCSIFCARIGSKINHTNTPEAPIKILGNKSIYFSKSSPIYINTKTGKFKVSGNTKVGS